MKKLIHYALLLTTLFAACVWMIEARGAETSRTITNYLVYIGTYTGPEQPGDLRL